MAAGLGALKALQSENFFKKAYEFEGWKQVAWKKLSFKHEIIGNTRGLGAYCAIDLEKTSARTTMTSSLAFECEG